MTDQTSTAELSAEEVAYFESGGETLPQETTTESVTQAEPETTTTEPTPQDRDEKGKGFTHKLGDVVSIRADDLGMLVNRVNHCDKVEPWSFGVTDLLRNLAARGLL